MQLVQRARAGEAHALDELLARYLPRLSRWASGRLPRWARDLRETQDLVHDTFLAVLPHLERFEFRHEGAFQTYLRHCLMNRLRDEVRRVSRRPRRVDTEPEAPDRAASPLEEAIGKETVVLYETALGRLKAEEQQAIVARLEMGQSYDEIAAYLGKPSPEAARMTVSRALLHLAKEMHRGT